MTWQGGQHYCELYDCKVNFLVVFCRSIEGIKKHRIRRLAFKGIQYLCLCATELIFAYWVITTTKPQLETKLWSWLSCPSHLRSAFMKELWWSLAFVVDIRVCWYRAYTRNVLKWNIIDGSTSKATYKIIYIIFRLQ